MNDWKELKKGGDYRIIARRIWRHEAGLPRRCRTWILPGDGSETAFRAFLDRCDMIFGLFSRSDSEIDAVVYVEETGPGVVMLHLSVLREVSAPDLVRLRNRLFHMGSRVGQCWVLRRHKGLCSLLSEVGFKLTGNTEREVVAGRPLTWTLAEVVRA